jgi:hypothetical protein
VKVFSDGSLNLTSQRRHKQTQLNFHLDIAISQMDVGERTFVLGTQLVAVPRIVDPVLAPQVPCNTIHTITRFAALQTVAMFYMNTRHSRICTMQNKQPYSTHSPDILDSTQTVR